ncbi:hypothetical protein AUJ83_01695 [Candidatus Woesearchaeota archaeon CG1_02_33_12]|nr:MAG: hypothetical protein AUJ83_01695 [Candidatus Woesearchaeota archaeon CG1_02_33_12]
MAKNMKISIKSNGTPDGTSLMVNGADITKTQSVTDLYFNAYGDYVSLSWTVLDVDDKGVRKSTSYRYSTPAVNQTIEVAKSSTPPKFIGKDSDMQFETEKDKINYDLTGTVKVLSDVIDIKEDK